MTWKRLPLALASFLAVHAVLFAVLNSAPVAAEEFLPTTVPIALDPADDAKDKVGELVFLGGVQVEPGDAELGGISGLEWNDGQLFAVQDDGRWLILTPDEIGDKLVDLIAAESGPLLGVDGKRLRGKNEADAEALTRTLDGSWLVAFEHDHRILRYTALDGAPVDAGLPIVDLVFSAADNNGLETLASGPDGLLACGEWAAGDTLNCMRERSDGLIAFEVSAPPEIAERDGVPTDAACASNGICYVLFRSYSREEGNAAAIMAVSPDNMASLVATFLPPLNLDNFEGLAVREDEGRTYLYLASDNNFSGNQRTLIMKFEHVAVRQDVAPEPPPVTAIDTGQYETVSVVLETELGDITIALETERAPITAANFLRYVDEDRFDGTVFYRAMSLDREPRPNGLIQGGTQWDPDRVLPGITHEPTNQTGLSHTSGALSMAMGEPGTANGDFSIMLQDQTGLDAQPESDNPVWKHGYAVFGYVTEGMDVVAKIHAAPVDPDKGEGWLKGQLLADPVTIIDARRIDSTP